MLCPVCGGSKLKHGSHLVPYTYKGRKTVFSLVGDKCPVCDEITLDRTECETLDRMMEQFEHSVNADLYERSSASINAKPGNCSAAEPTPFPATSWERQNRPGRCCSFFSF